MAFAGVGTPIKLSLWRVSMLNLASLIAENMGTNKKVYWLIQKPGPIQAFARLYKIKPGATPKLTTSANESSCLPNSPLTFKMRATNPSKKSITADSPINIDDMINSPCIALKIDRQPNSKFAEVIALGICCFKICIYLYKQYCK